VKVVSRIISPRCGFNPQLKWPELATLKGSAREISKETKNPLLFFRDFTDGNGYVAEEFFPLLSRMTHDATHDAR
jgi:hypothetical protein